MAINQLLNDKNAFELVRDRIAFILLEEITNQRTLAESGALANADYFKIINSFFSKDKLGDLQLNLFSERFRVLEISELNAINVYFDTSNYPTGSSVTQHSSSLFMIDVMVAQKGTSEYLGDVLSSLYLQKMLGVIRNIIMAGIYITLGFDRPFVKNRWINSLANFRPKDQLSNPNIDNVTDGNLSLKVEFNEKNLGVLPVDLEENFTNIYIDEENGLFQIENENLNSN